MNLHPTSEISEAFIALGANLGDREHTLMDAIAHLDKHPEIEVQRCSDLYETDPVGYLDQPCFVNMVIAVKTTLNPEALLTEMLNIELILGRERLIRFGPRTVDLDLLWMDGLQIDTTLLTLPHPRMFERAFVLVPLADIVTASNRRDLFEEMQHALAHVEGKEGVRFWKSSTWHDGFALSEN